MIPPKLFKGKVNKQKVKEFLINNSHERLKN
jgi:hypothetical protein